MTHSEPRPVDNPLPESLPGVFEHRSNRRGRHSCLDAERKSNICAMLAVGCTKTTAARYVGCAPGTITRRAKKEPEFAAALARAEAQQEFVLLKRIYDAAADHKHWRAAAWMLARRWPERYGAHFPEHVTVQQISLSLNQIAQVIMEEIGDPEQRRRVVERVQELNDSLQRQADDQRRIRWSARR